MTIVLLLLLLRSSKIFALLSFLVVACWQQQQAQALSPLFSSSTGNGSSRHVRPSSILQRLKNNPLSTKVEDLPVPPSKQIGYGEESRKYRRTIYSHADWEKHRGQDRFIRNLSTAMKSGIYKNIRKYVVTVTALATVLCAWNKAAAAHLVPQLQLSLPLAPFSLAMPSLGLLLVFRTNTSYARWDEARKNWGLNINHTRDLTRMAVAYYDDAVPHSPTRQEDLQRIALGAWAFARAMKRHLSPDHIDEVKFRNEITQRLGNKGQAQALMDATHRPNRALQDLSTAIEALPIHFLRKDKLHASLTKFEDNLGSSERLLSSPVPLFYSRHTTRFLAVWVLLLPLALYQAFGGHLATIPTTAILSTCLFGIDELATQLEEPFTILPMQSFCQKIYDACTEIVSFQPIVIMASSAMTDETQESPMNNKTSLPHMTRSSSGGRDLEFLNVRQDPPVNRSSNSSSSSTTTAAAGGGGAAAGAGAAKAKSNDSVSP